MSYINRADIEALFGIRNVRVWADLDNDGVEATITLRVNAAINYAQAYVDDNLRGGQHVIPFTEPPPTMIVDTAAKLAGVWLYGSRRSVDVSDDSGRPLNEYAGHRKEADTVLRRLRAGTLRLSVMAYQTAPEIQPYVVED